MRPYYVFAIDGKTVMSYEKPSFEAAKGGYIFVNKNGDIEFALPETPKEESKQVLPDEPIDVARKLIQATVTTKVPKCGALYSGMETESIEIIKYDVVQLQEIAEHLLAYCNAQERGCVDACCKNCEP